MESKKQIKQETEKIIKDLSLLKILNEIGEAKLVGSVALNLIVKLDIDIHVYIGRRNLINTVNHISSILLDYSQIKEIRISDFRHKDSIKIGIDEYKGNHGNWTIDLWITKDRNTTVFEKTEEILKKLTSKHRENILSIKQYYFNQGLLRDGISPKIYDAVINKDVTSVHGFKNL